MHKLPVDLDLDLLPGPNRGVSPALYFRDEAVFSPTGKYFALAYTITEASMCNDVGCLLWGTNKFFWHNYSWQPSWSEYFMLVFTMGKLAR